MKILLNILTHGDERIGLKVAKEIEKQGISPKILTIHVANKKAYLAKRRYIDKDLNRSFPGKKNGNHEERLAFKLSQFIKKFDVVIDIHSTTSDLKDALIVTKLDAETQHCVEIISPKYLLIMRATKNNALISRAKVGLAFEYCKDNDTNGVKKIVRDILGIFSYYGISTNARKPGRRSTRYFDVVGTVEKPKGFKLIKSVKNYKVIYEGQAYARKGQKVLVAKEDFCPILFGQNTYENYFGFKAKEIKP